MKSGYEDTLHAAVERGLKEATDEKREDARCCIVTISVRRWLNERLEDRSWAVSEEAAQ